MATCASPKHFSWNPKTHPLQTPPGKVIVISQKNEEGRQATLFDSTYVRHHKIETISDWHFNSLITKLTIQWPEGIEEEITKEDLAKVFQQAITNAHLPPNGKPRTRLVCYTFTILEEPPYLQLSFGFEKQFFLITPKEALRELTRIPSPEAALTGRRSLPPKLLFDSQDPPHLSAHVVHGHLAVPPYRRRTSSFKRRPITPAGPVEGFRTARLETAL